MVIIIFVFLKENVKHSQCNNLFNFFLFNNSTNKKSRHQSSANHNTTHINNNNNMKDVDNHLFSDQLLRLTNSAEEQGFSDLQAFVVEAASPDDENKNSDNESENNNNTKEELMLFQTYFRPSMIYLPVRARLSDSISLRVRLRPVIVEQQSKLLMNDSESLSGNARINDIINNSNNNNNNGDLSFEEDEEDGDGDGNMHGINTNSKVESNENSSLLCE